MGHDSAGGAIQAVFDVGVAYPLHDIAGDAIEVQAGIGGDFTGDHDKVLGSYGFASDPSHGVVAEDGIQHGVGDLVTQLVWVPFGYRLGSQQVRGRVHECETHWNILPNCIKSRLWLH